MKCPHCGKLLEQNDPYGPQTLLAHVNSNLRHNKERVRRYTKSSIPENEWPYRVSHNVKKWQAWSDWIEKKIEEEQVQ